MSEMGSGVRLQPAALQFPVSWYFDEALFRRELEIFFRRGPGYVGHEAMVYISGSFVFSKIA